MQAATTGKKQFDESDLVIAKAMIEEARAVMRDAMNHPVDDKKTAGLAMHRANIAVEECVGYAATLAALLTNRSIIKAAELANESIISNLALRQTKDPDERRKFWRQADDLNSKAKKAANDAVVFARTHMTEPTRDIAEGDMTFKLPHSQMPVFRLQHFDDDHIAGCSDLDAYDRDNNFFWDGKALSLCFQGALSGPTRVPA